MKQKPFVSVILSVRNGQEYLEESIQSILKQTYKNFELIVVNDCSTDRTGLILSRIRDNRTKLINNRTPQGLTKSLNIALEKSRGDYIARMDADDVSRADRLELQTHLLRSNPKIGLVGSWSILIDGEGSELKLEKFPITDSEIKENLFIYNPIKHPSVMFKRKLVDLYGCYDEKFDGAEDYDLWLRWAPYTQYRNIKDPLISYRIHKQRVSYKEEKKVLLQAIRVRIHSVFSYGYPKNNLTYLAIPLISYFIPSKIKNYYRNLTYLLLRNLIKVIQKTSVFTSLGMRLVKITGKYPYPVHPKHLNPNKKDWFLNYIKKKDIVLDIGCNNGQNTIKAAGISGKVFAFDNDEKLLNIAKKDTYNRGLNNINYFIHNAEKKLPFKSNTFDVVMFFAVLEHLVNRDRSIREVNRVLKRGGKLLLSVPNGYTTWKNIQKNFNLPYFADHDHKVEYGRNNIIALLTKHGFEVKKCSPVSFDMPLVGIIDLIGGISLSLYRRLSQIRRRLVLKHPEETVSFEIVAEKTS